MQRVLIIVLFLLSSATKLFPQEYKVFHTSICYDLLCSIENYENVLSNSQFTGLAKDSAFISKLKNVNEKVRASNLCNFYSSLPTSKNNVDSCIIFLKTVKRTDIPKEFEGKYIDNIFDVLPEISFIITRLVEEGYVDYWISSVFPKIENAINNYKFEEGILEKIHQEIISLAGSSELNEDYSKIYILDIGNAFSLNDETFCCTYALLDKELAKKYRINFLQVYIHENLHRIYLSKDLMRKLDYLYDNNEFYRSHEDIARGYGEGKNEAFIVAAESFVSHKLGLKTKEDVLIEFQEYVEGSLVLSPIIYTYLPNKKNNQSFDSFLLSLFDKKYISAKKLEQQYNSAIKKLKI